MRPRQTCKLEPYLHDERAVLGRGGERLGAVAGVAHEHGRVQHGRVAELGAVAPRQQPPRQLARVHHGRDHEPRRAQRLPEGHAGGLGPLRRPGQGSGLRLQDAGSAGATVLGEHPVNSNDGKHHQTVKDSARKLFLKKIKKNKK